MIQGESEMQVQHRRFRSGNLALQLPPGGNSPGPLLEHADRARPRRMRRHFRPRIQAGALFAFAFSVFALATAFALHADPVRPQAEQRKINFLIEAVGSSDAIFVRNGAEYPAARAADHMRMKLNRAGSRVQTARDFIEGVASRSYLTGNPYYIQFADGRRVQSRQWLLAKLKALEARQAAQSSSGGSAEGACCSLEP